MRKLTEPLTRACELAESLDDFVLAAKLSDCIEWIQSSRYDGAGDHDVSP
ncbi:hypothetical protein [Sphingomonas sp. R86521]